MGKSSQKSKSTSQSIYPAAMTNLMNAQQTSATPILQMLAQNIMQALQTGGRGANIPILQRANEAGQNAVAATNNQTNQSLARGNAGPFGRQISEGGAEQGAFDVSQIGPQIIQMLMSMAPDLSMLRGSGVFGNAVGTKTTSKGSGSSFSL